MKKQVIAILIASLPVYSKAQPTVTRSEDFSAGASVRTQACQPVAPGTPGANQTWNFANISPIAGDTTRLVYMNAPAGNAFGANLLVKTSDSSIIYLNKTTSNTFLAGIVDSTADGNGAIMSYAKNTMFQSVRTLTYGMSITDYYADTIIANGVAAKGKGNIAFEVDGYGTLVLPTGTYKNVLRVRTEQVQNDTITAPFATTMTTTTISYKWYDNSHSAPLLRIDSTYSQGGNEATAEYLLNDNTATAVNDMPTTSLQLYGAVNNNILLLRGDLKQGKKYGVQVYNLNGQNIYKSDFMGQGETAAVDLNRNIEPGMYVVKLWETGTTNTAILKLSVL